MDTYYWTSLNAALWTVAVEMQFYLLFPLLARAFGKRPALTFSLMTLAALVSRALERTSVDIYGRCQPEGNIILFHFSGGCRSACAARRFSIFPAARRSVWTVFSETVPSGF